jgi:hypothetical protein
MKNKNISVSICVHLWLIINYEILKNLRQPNRLGCNPRQHNRLGCNPLTLNIKG